MKYESGELLLDAVQVEMIIPFVPLLKLIIIGTLSPYPQNGSHVIAYVY